MANVKKTANAQKQARPVFNLSDYQFNRSIALFVKNHFAAAREMTKNGTLKLTTSRPELKDDIKNTAKVGEKVFYLVPSSPNTKGVLTSLVSYCDYLDAVRIQAKKQENTKNFNEWVESVEAKKQFEAIELIAGVSVTDDQKQALYKKYLKDRGL